MKYRLAAIPLFFSALAGAESFNTIATITHIDNDNFDTTAVGITHYYEAKETLGPLDQFSFINSNSLVNVNYADSDFSDSLAVNGEWYSDTGLFLGAGYTNFDIDDSFPGDTSIDGYSGTVGYQSSGNWSVSATYADTDADNSESSLNFSARYKHKLSGEDFLGFSYSTNDDTDFHNVGVRYFSTLNNGQYLVVDANYADFDGGGDDWNIAGSWYFNKKTSLLASIGDDSAWEIGGQHYFNNNWAISASYSEDDFLDDGVWRANVRAQF